MNIDWCWSTAVDIAAAVRRGDVSATDVAQSHLERIRRENGRLGCYLLVDERGALDQARAVDAAVARGDDPGTLAGVPIALKDLLVTKDLETTAGSRVLQGWIPPYDGTAVERLRRSGAVILGKLNLDEFGMGSSNENSAYGVCRNPWDTTRVPGGSSGGAAAAVADGLCALAFGTDTGGSIRQPAALCGCVGLKPTYGRVSRYGVIAFASSLDQVGPLARTVEDCAVGLEVIAGHDPRDATSIDAPVPAYAQACHGEMPGLRIGVPTEYFSDGLDARVRARVVEAIDRMRALGAEIVDVSLPSARYAIATYYLLSDAEASSNLARYDGVRYGLRVPAETLSSMYVRTRNAGFGAEVKRRILLGTYILSAGYYDAYYIKAQQIRTLIRRDFDAAFERCDVIATPTSPVPAFPIGERTSDPLSMYLADVYTVSCPLAGLPGLSVPCGFTDEGLPVGLQLLGPPLADAALLRAAAAYQHATDWHRRRPPQDGRERPVE